MLGGDTLAAGLCSSSTQGMTHQTGASTASQPPNNQCGWFSRHVRKCSGHLTSRAERTSIDLRCANTGQVLTTCLPPLSPVTAAGSARMPSVIMTQRDLHWAALRLLKSLLMWVHLLPCLPCRSNSLASSSADQRFYRGGGSSSNSGSSSGGDRSSSGEPVT